MKRNINQLNISLYGFVNNTSQTIQVGSVGYLDADNRNSHGYYIVQFLSLPYNHQENKTIDGKVIESGELVSKVGYFSTDISHSISCVNKREGNIKTTISLINVIKYATSVSIIKFIK